VIVLHRLFDQRHIARAVRLQQRLGREGLVAGGEDIHAQRVLQGK
jgi:hypothetical protein